jgi:hypothetical protein
MRVYMIFVIFSSIIVSEVNGQTDTINFSYYQYLQNILSKDSSIKDFRYVCNKYKNGKIKDQHMYVKYKSDSIERFWRIGKCFYYYENGNLESSTDIDLILKKHVGIGLSLDEKGDTTWATFWGNLNGKVLPTNTIFSVDGLGKIYEMYPDKYKEILEKK